MAIPTTTIVEPVHNDLITSYAVECRDVEFPILRCKVSRVQRIMEDPVVVQTSSDLNADLLYESLVIPEWLDRTDLIGHTVWNLDGDEIGAISAWDNATTTVTLTTGSSVELTSESIQIQGRNPFGAPLYKPVAPWPVNEYLLQTVNTDALNYTKTLMFLAYQDAALRLMEELGDTTYTPEQINAAIISLGQKGISVDSFLAAQAEKLIEDYEADLLPFATKM